MPTPWILESKIAAPAPAAGWQRPSPIGEAEPLPPVTLLVAGPGYGKTRALAALAARAGTTAWLAVDAGDALPATFFHYVVAALRRSLPDFGQAVTDMLTSEGVEPRVVWHQLFRELASYNIPSALIALDDVHHLLADAPEILRGLVGSLDALPPGVHLALSTRRKLGIPLARQQAAGKVRLIGQDKLRFDENERAAFLSARANGGPVPAAWAEGAAALDGWPLGLELLTHGLSPSHVGVDALAAQDELSGYVAEEFFLSQPEARRGFMLQAVLLAELDPEACRQAFGRGDAAAQLEALEADMLVERLAGGAGLRFPAYLESFLRAEGARTVPEPVFASWKRGAASYYMDHGRPEAALPHFVDAGDWPEAMRAAQSCFPTMLATGRLGAIERILQLVPAETGAAEPLVSLWRGVVCANRGQHADALPWVEQALEGFRAREDRAFELKAIVRLAGFALLARDMPKFGRLAVQAMALLEHGRPEDVADLHLMRALAAESRGDMALMRECNETVLTLPTGDNVEVATCRAIALLNLFTASWHAGDLAVARNRIDEAVEVAEAWHMGATHLFAQFLRAQLCLTEGDIAGAGTILRGLPQGWEARLDWHDRACALTIQGDFLISMGDERAGEELLRKAMTIFERADFREGIKVPLERLLWQALRRRQPARALELYAEAGEPQDTNIYDQVLAIAEARAKHMDDEVAAAAKAWDHLVPALTDLGARLHLTRARLYEAATRLKLDERDAAAAAFAEAEAAIAHHGYHFLHETDRALWEELTPLIQVAAPALVVPTPAPAASPAAAAPAPRRGTAPLVDRRTTPPLEIRLLGAFEIFQGGVRLDQWPRKRARLILAALALYHRGLTAEQLADMLGEDTGTPAYLATTRVNVMTLRKVLEPELGKREGSRYVGFENDRYFLIGGTLEALDVKAFDEAVDAGDRKKATDPKGAFEDYTRAMAAYRGNLLEDGSLALFFEAERERYRRRALDVLVWLANEHGRRGDGNGEGSLLTRAVALAPCEEEIYVRLMRHHLAAGRPERVRQAYWDCRKALKGRLGIAPSDDFERAFRELVG